MTIRRVTGTELGAVMNGVPVFLGVVIATTTKNNHDTATPFNDAATGSTSPTLEGKCLLLQPDTACWVKFGAVNTVTASATATAGSIYLAARERVIVNMPEGYGWVACVAVSGTTNLQVHGML